MTSSVLIVGAGPGLGLAIGQRFAQAGWSVAMIARNSSTLDAMADDLPDVPVHVETADVTVQAELTAAVKATFAAFGTADVVISNTSMYTEGLPTAVSPDAFERTWRVACLSNLLALQAVCGPMRERGSGVFLMPGTPLATKPWPGAAALGSAKAAARNLIMAAHQELLPDSIFASVVTIDGIIKPGTAFDPALIADYFYEIANLPAPAWQPEHLYHP